jgi:hypothetical protein
MGEDVEIYEHEPQCADGRHDFAELPVSAAGELGIVLGASRCWACGVVASDDNVEPPAEGLQTAVPAAAAPERP